MGKKVIYTGKGGTEYDKETANKHLLVGARYTIEEEIVFSWHTNVYLEEIHDVWPSGNRIYFNSVMFREENEEESRAEFVERAQPNVVELMDWERRKDKSIFVKNQTKQAEAIIAELRKTCQHANTFEGTWERAIAHQIQAVICSDCGSLIKEITA